MTDGAAPPPVISPSVSPPFDERIFDRFPTPGPPRHMADVEALERIWAPARGWRIFSEVNNNVMGLLFLGTALLFFVLAGVLALLIRLQLAVPLNEIMGEETYNQVFTMHGTLMMFLFAVPAVEAFAVILLPQMLGTRELPFPRLQAFAYWAYLIGGLAFFSSLFFGQAPDGGWFMYPPLTSWRISEGINTDWYLLGIGFIEVSAIAGAIEIVVGVLKNRAPGMTLDKMPVFAWAMLAFAGMVMIGFPAIILATTLLELERSLHWPYFDAVMGGDPLLWQHLFWFFGHPEVYIIFLPAAGIMSMIIPAVVQAPLAAYRLVVLALIATGFISFGVWVHHMYATGLPNISVSFFSAASMAVSVPAGIQVFAWIATIANGRFRFNTPGLFTLGFLFIFVIGGLTGVMAAMAPFDWQAHDTYFIVAHLHYVLIGGMVFPMFAGIYYWTPMVSRTPLSERLGRWAFWLMFTGVNVTFFTMHLTGLMGMPRRVATYMPNMGWEIPNLVSTAGAFVIAAGVGVFLVDMIRNFRPVNEGSAGNVFNGGTFEWLNNGNYSALSIPVTVSREPLWDRPEIAREVDEGRWFLPNAPTGGREALVTSPIRALPQYLVRIPGPGWDHFGASVFMAAGFLLLTVQQYWPSLAAFALMLVFIVRWTWGIDKGPEFGDVDIGGGVRVPSYVNGPGSHGWWAMIVLLIVLGMIYVSMIFSYLFLWSSNLEVWPDPATPTPPLAQFWAASALDAGALGTLVLAGRQLARNLTGRVAALLCASFGLLLAALLVDGLGQWTSGARPDADAHGAVVYGLLLLQAAMTFTVAITTGVVVGRALTGHLGAHHRASFDCLWLLSGFTVVQGLVGLCLTRLFPLAL